MWCVNGFLEEKEGLLRETSKRNHRGAFYCQNDGNRQRTSGWLLGAAFSCGSPRTHPGIWISKVWSRLVDNSHQNLSMINSLLWGRVKLEHCDVFEDRIAHNKHANLIL